MSVLFDDAFGLDSDRVHAAPSLPTFVRRRVAGRFALDPFGLDPQLSDLCAPMLEKVVRVDVTGGDHIPRVGPPVLMMNRGFGVIEPTALSVAVVRETGRARGSQAHHLWPSSAEPCAASARSSSSADDVHAALASGNLVIVPMAATSLRGRAGTPPLELLQSIMEYAVVPVAVRPGGPFGTAIAPRGACACRRARATRSQRAARRPARCRGARRSRSPRGRQPPLGRSARASLRRTRLDAPPESAARWRAICNVTRMSVAIALTAPVFTTTSSARVRAHRC